MHQMVRADRGNKFSWYWTIAVIIFAGLRRNVIDFSDVHELALVHFELHETETDKLFERKEGDPPSSRTVVMDSQALKEELIR